ncbi:MAG: NAD(P)/FAD-dependent oxidoreductase [bacterium]|nr:NAD(P)/FAD-dependent oxidoreductase [bacterium]
MAARKFDNWEPITESDSTIQAALEDASIPSLMVALVHLTGDESIMRGDIRPRSRLLADPQAGVTEEQQAVVRAQAFEILKAYRDGGCQLPPAPNLDQIAEMMNFIIGEPLLEAYAEFLVGELSLHGEDPFGQPGMEQIPQKKKDAFHVLVIGAGMSGILAAHRLKEAGIPCTVIEKNADVGGTWLENTYPGCRVDSPNHTYSYSFVPKNWPQFFSSQKVLLEYFDQCASDFGIRDNIRFNTEVERAEFDEQSQTWNVRIRNADGTIQILNANAIIGAVGQLNRPRRPDIEGRDAFSGPSFHTAQWEHEHDLTGKRIGVIGTGASAFQSVPEIAKQAREVVVFQRTPPWVRPQPIYHDYVSDGKHWLLNHVPYYAKWFRFFMFWRSGEGMLEASKKDPAWPHQTRSVSEYNDRIRANFTKYITSIVGDDPELLQKCIPDYPPGGKRILVDNGTWLKTLRRDNVHLITDPIAKITEAGLVTESGETYEFDVIIYATGFYPSRILWPMEIRGLGGLDLQTHWDGDPHAYKGVSIPQFPNFFCMYGPNTNIVVNTSIIFFSECEMRYILGCIKLLLETDQASMDCKQDVHDTYNEWIDEGNANMAWGAPTVKSWYKNEKGRVTQNWPFTLLKFWQQTKGPDPSDYIFRSRKP